MADPVHPNPVYPNPAYPEPFAADGSLTAAIVIYALYMVALFTGGLSMIFGVILAYVLRRDAGPAARSHYTFLIRTFWGGFVLILAGVALMIVGAPLLVLLIGIPIMAVGALLAAGAHLWQIVRCGFGLWHAASGRAYPEPLSPLV